MNSNLNNSLPRKAVVVDGKMVWVVLAPLALVNPGDNVLRGNDDSGDRRPNRFVGVALVDSNFGDSSLVLDNGSEVSGGSSASVWVFLKDF